VAPVDGADHAPVVDVERGEQGRDAVPQVVVGAPLGHPGHPGHHRQDRLGPVQGLDLRLLIDAQHHCLLRRVVVEPDGVDDLGGELWVVRELEPVLEVRLEIELPPDPPDRRGREAGAFGHRGSRPVRRMCGLGLEGRRDDLLDLLEQVEGGRPTRGSSTSPAVRASANRCRHLPTVARVTMRSAATRAFDAPSAHASTIAARSASFSETAPRDQPTNSARSASDKTISTGCGPGGI